VRIPNQALAVSITGSVGGAELDLRTGAEQQVVRATAHHAVLPRITGEVTIGVRPVGAPRFGPGHVIHLAIAHDNPAEVDPVQVLFDPVDGSAAAATDVVVGVVAAAGIRNVAAVLVGAEVTPVVIDAPGAADSGVAQLADAVRRARPRWSAGARWSRLATGPRIIACTDSPASAVRQGFSVIGLSNDPRFDAMGARLPSPRQGQDASDELLAHQHVLDRITAALARALI
jgi:hypothetical protein